MRGGRGGGVCVRVHTRHVKTLDFGPVRTNTLTHILSLSLSCTQIGMEQFERRSYKVKLHAATHDAREIDWLLDSLKLYEFPGWYPDYYYCAVAP